MAKFTAGKMREWQRDVETSRGLIPDEEATHRALGDLHHTEVRCQDHRPSPPTSGREAGDTDNLTAPKIHLLKIPKTLLTQRGFHPTIRLRSLVHVSFNTR